MTMYLISVISFFILGGFLILAAMRYGIPDMVSDTYYQLQGTTGSEIIPFESQKNMGWIFTAVMIATAMLMLVCILDTGRGIQFLAFVGCSGLAFVGVTPNYLDQSEGTVHKAAATIAAIGCVGWCLSVLPLPTLLIATLYAVYFVAASLCKALGGIWYISNSVRFHPWYWAEVAAFVDVYVTYWTM